MDDIDADHPAPLKVYGGCRKKRRPNPNVNGTLFIMTPSMTVPAGGTTHSGVLSQFEFPGSVSEPSVPSPEHDGSTL
jgi:hypothetical protein